MALVINTNLSNINKDILLHDADVQHGLPREANAKGTMSGWLGADQSYAYGQ